MLKLILLIFIFSTQGFAFDKIIGGSLPQGDHPGKYNTVALIKASNKKVFCTGSLISKTMILTAKHCLADKKVEDFLVFFGDDTNNLEAGIIKSPLSMKVRMPKDWEMTFPSFDVAWIKLKEEAPENFIPLPILSLKEELSNSVVHLAGHGNSSPVNGKVEAGKKLITTTNLKNYYDNPRFFHILLFEDEEGRGACHGDSGGPAYIKTEKGWAIIGVTNGFDIVLTPKSMARTNDDEFPYRVDCKKNQILYSFAGAHGNWIEKSSNETVLKTRDFQEFKAEESGENNSISEWCQRRDFGSPNWNFLKLLLDKKVDSMAQEEAEAFYNNCTEVESYLSNLKEVRIDGEKTMDADYSLSPLHLLSLKTLKIFNSDANYFNFDSVHEIGIENLTLQEMGFEDLKFLENSNLRVSKIDLGFNSLKSLEGLHKIKGLKGVLLTNTLIKDFSPLIDLKDLEELDLSSTSLKSSKVLKNFKLKSLAIGSDELMDLSLEGQDKLEELFVRSTNHFKLDLLKETPNLRSAHLAHLKISDLSALSNLGLGFLEKLNLTGNPIINVSPLKGLTSLKSLRLFGTPLARKEVLKTPENCPLDGPLVLTRFCSNP